MKLPIIWSLFQNKNDCVCIGGETIADLLQAINAQKPDLFGIAAESVESIAQDLNSWVKTHPHSRKKIQSSVILDALTKANITPPQETAVLETYFIRPLKDAELYDEIQEENDTSKALKEILSNHGIGPIWDFIDDEAVYYEEETGDVFTAESYAKELKRRGKTLDDLYYVNENGDLIPFGLADDSSEMTLIQKSMRDFGIVLVKDCFTNDDSITLDDVEAIQEFIDDEMPETLVPFSTEEKLDLIEAVKAEIEEGNWEMPPRNLDYDEDNDEDVQNWLHHGDTDSGRWSDDEWGDDKYDDDKYDKDKYDDDKDLDDDSWDDDKWDQEYDDDDRPRKKWR